MRGLSGLPVGLMHLHRASNKGITTSSKKLPVTILQTFIHVFNSVS